MLIVEEIKKQIAKTQNKHQLRFNKTVCKQVAYRDEDLKEFAKKHELIIFVSGKKSSNGKMLFEACKKINPKTYFISHYQEIEKKWFKNIKSVGISGATSTPRYQLEKVKEYIITTVLTHIIY
jgi:4-hydroxy-3-methylbut-2-enyl diphosphate reductase